MSVPYNDPIWDCGVCGNKGPWLLTLWFLAPSVVNVPGGVSWCEPDSPWMARACSMECGKRFARAAGSDRISITRPQRDIERIDDSIRWLREEREAAE